MKLNKWIVGVAASLMAVALLQGAEEKKPKAKPYPLDTCVVSGEKLGGMGEGHEFVQEGQTIKLCCKDCEAAFKKDTAKFMKKIAEANKKVKPYPLKTCVVSGEKLGGMGEEHVIVHASQEIKFCCKDCEKVFRKDTAKFMKKIEEAAKKEKS
jgi:hypothetical protein